MDWIAGGASSVGRGHKGRGAACQDVHSVVTLGLWSFIVVADGAGSARHSEYGANRLVEAMTSALPRSLDVSAPRITHEILRRTVVSVIESVRSRIVSDGYDLGDCHATLLAAIASPEEAHLFHIGDGGAVVLSEAEPGKWCFASSLPSNGDYANETCFFTEDQWQDALNTAQVASPRAVMLASDGMWPFMWDLQTGVRPGFVLPILQSLVSCSTPQEASRFVSSVVTDSQTDLVTDDDKTLVIAANASGRLADWLRRDSETSPMDSGPTLRVEGCLPRTKSESSETDKSAVARSAQGLGVKTRSLLRELLEVLTRRRPDGVSEPEK